MPTTLSPSPSVSSLHVLPISRMSVYIFLTTFFLESHSRLAVFSPAFLFHRFRYLSFERTCLSSLFIVALSLFLSPSFFPRSFPRNACAFHPEKWIFLFGKKGRKKRVFVTRCARVVSGPRANEAVPSVRASTVARRTTEEGCRRGRG